MGNCTEQTHPRQKIIHSLQLIKGQHRTNCGIYQWWKKILSLVSSAVYPATQQFLNFCLPVNYSLLSSLTAVYHLVPGLLGPVEIWDSMLAETQQETRIIFPSYEETNVAWTFRDLHLGLYLTLTSNFIRYLPYLRIASDYCCITSMWKFYWSYWCNRLVSNWNTPSQHIVD